jgi:hypothetical protein
MVFPQPDIFARLPGLSSGSWVALASSIGAIPPTGLFSVRTAASYVRLVDPSNLGWMEMRERRLACPPPPVSTVHPTTTRKDRFGVPLTQCAAVSTLFWSIREAPQKRRLTPPHRTLRRRARPLKDNRRSAPEYRLRSPALSLHRPRTPVAPPTSPASARRPQPAYIVRGSAVDDSHSTQLVLSHAFSPQSRQTDNGYWQRGLRPWRLHYPSPSVGHALASRPRTLMTTRSTAISTTHHLKTAPQKVTLGRRMR